MLLSGDFGAVFDEIPIGPERATQDEDGHIDNIEDKGLCSRMSVAEPVNIIGHKSFLVYGRILSRSAIILKVC